MQTHTNVPEPKPHGAVQTEEEIEVDVDNDPGNVDPGSQFDRDATVPLIDPEHPA
jgi:hypothetical protein